MDSKLKTIALTLLGLALSGATYFYGTGLHPRWWLTWLAPLPVLMLAPRLPFWYAAVMAFGAFLLQGLNMFTYYQLVAPVAVVFMVVLIPAILFAAVVLVFRSFRRRGMLVRAAFVVPALWVAIEYLSEFKSPHGTFGNIAYSQMNFLPIIQIAAITGVWGISFLLFLFPSAIAALTGPARPTHQKKLVALVTCIIFVAALGFGIIRLRGQGNASHVTIGLLNTDAKSTMYPQGQTSVELMRAYCDHIPALAKRGAQIVVLPEKLGRFTDTEIKQADELLGASAKENHLTIAAGFHHLPNRNETRVYAADGTLEAVYEKHHMLPAFESELLVGDTRTTLSRPSGKIGLTICKDMDFPKLSRQYGNDNATLLLVPAWDFTADGWLHSRMAILRGVESGFSVARAPRLGNLTLTDDRGRVVAEQVTGSDNFDSVLAAVPVGSGPTLYARAGDWFAWFNLFVLAILFFPRWKPLPPPDSDNYFSPRFKNPLETIGLALGTGFSIGLNI